MRKKLCNIMCILAVMVLGCEVVVSDSEQWDDVSYCIDNNGLWVSGRCEYRSCKNGVLTTCSSVEGNDCEELLCEEDICNKLGTDCGYKDGTVRCRDLTDQKGILEIYSENDDIWEKTKSCEGFSCQDKKECGECLNNTRTCNNNLLKECKSGTWKEITSCECNQEGTDCKYNNEELRCRNIDDKSGVVEKYLDGNWEKTSSCSEGKASCQSSTECGECLNGTQQCDNESLKICGTGKWNTIQSCECNEEGTDCKYNNEDLRCRDIDGKSGIVEKYLDGNWEKTLSCSNGKASCQSSTECGECLNGTQQCDNESLKICDTGKWDTIQSCECNQEGTDCRYNNEELRCRNIDDKSGIIEKYLDGNWEKTSSCSNGKASCQSSTKCGECLNETQQCSNYNTSDGNILQICKDGKWQKDDTCNNECYKDECVDIDNQSCSEEENGNLRCVNVMGSGSALYVCNNKSWNDLYSCNNGICNAKYTNCEGSFEVCEDEYIQCLNDQQYIECQKGVWSDRKSLKKYEQCQNGKNGIIVNQKEKCEYFGGVFSDEQCICVENDRLYTCSDLNCSSLTGNNIGNDNACKSMSCNGHKYYCVNNSLYKCNNSEMIKWEQINMGYSYKNMWTYYNEMGRTQEFNKKVIESLMELNVENDCDYDIFINEYATLSCVLEYNKSTGFTCSNNGNSRCPTNCSDYLQKEIDIITLNNNCWGGQKQEKLQNCSIKIENCTDIDISDPDNMTFKVDCSDN